MTEYRTESVVCSEDDNCPYFRETSRIRSRGYFISPPLRNNQAEGERERMARATASVHRQAELLRKDGNSYFNKGFIGAAIDAFTGVWKNNGYKL